MPVRDHSVSGQTFPLVECRGCGMRLTQDAPEAEAIGPYYDSPHYISHTDSRNGWTDRLYQAARGFTLRSKQRLLARVTGQPRGKLVDYGAGTGAFVRHMAERNWDVTGLEPDRGARDRAQHLYGLRLREPSWLNEAEAGTLDAVTLWHVLEHLHDLEGTLRQLRRLLKGSGVMLVAVPNYRAADERTYGAHWAAYDVPRHLYHFTPQSVAALAARCGLRVDEMKGMPLDAFYIALLSEQYRSGRKRPVRAFWQGLRSNLHAWGHPERSSSVIYILRPA